MVKVPMNKLKYYLISRTLTQTQVQNKGYYLGLDIGSQVFGCAFAEEGAARSTPLTLTSSTSSPDLDRVSSLQSFILGECAKRNNTAPLAIIYGLSGTPDVT